MTGPAAKRDAASDVSVRLAAHAAARTSAAMVALLCGLILASFALPFASVSCGDARTETLTGFDLVTGANPGIREARGSPSSPEDDDRREAEAAVSRLRFFARTEFALAAVGLVFAVGAATFSNAHRPAPKVLMLPGALASGLSFVTGVAAGMLDVFGPTIHHYGGLWTAAFLSWVAILPAAAYASYETSDLPPAEPGFRRLGLILAGAALVVGSLALVAARGGEQLFLPVGMLAIGVSLAAFVVGLMALITCRLSGWAVAVALVGGLPPALIVGSI